jgi:hypothetical protein
MTTLLILGSKADPALPPRAAYHEVACANASGFSAARHGLPTPAYTVMTAVLTSGKAEDDHSLQALRGLATRELYHLPRPAPRGGPLKHALTHLKQWRLKPYYMQHQLRRLGYRYERFVVRSSAHYHELIRALCDHDPEISALIAAKQPSTGMFTLAIGVAERRWDRFILAGFDFGLSHAYGENPLIRTRGTTLSKHADTDVAIVRHLALRHGSILTTEPSVHERAGVPLLPAAREPPGHSPAELAADPRRARR